jgi:hypothetical protein
VNTKQPTTKWCELRTEFGDSNLEILDGALTGVIFRITKVGAIPQIDESVKLEFVYEFIHTGDIDSEVLTSAETNTIIIDVIREYLNLGDGIGKN